MDRATFDAEVNEMKMTERQEASLIASTLMSVVRDQPYLVCTDTCASKTVLFLFLSKEYTQMHSLITYKIGFSNFGLGQAKGMTLYTGEGDLISQFTRLLMICHERSDLFKDYVERANISISKMDIETKYMTANSYIKHMRNAILHGRFKVVVDKIDWNKSRIVLLDVAFYRNSPEVTAKISITFEELTEIFRILMEDVYRQYLDDIGWAIN